MLRSSNELRDFSIAASDGDIGQVEAFCFDDREWMVRYILVNTGGWLHPRKVLISPFDIGSVGATARGITTDFTREGSKDKSEDRSRSTWFAAGRKPCLTTLPSLLKCGAP